MKTIPLILLFLFSLICAHAQTSISFESQVYPTGIIPSVRFDYSINDQIQFFARGGYNFTDRRDWGEQENEEGGGSGFGLGAEFTDSKRSNFSLNVRADVWFMEIDWEEYIYIQCLPDVICTQTLDAVPSIFKKTTNIIVLQPTLGFGYQIPLSGSFFLKPTINLGYEINIHTKGEEVGQGTILLGGIQIGFLF